MVLVDTSVWVDHLRKGDEQLANMLDQNRVCCHPMIIGELACGNLRQREQLIALWQNLPSITEARHQDVMLLLDRQQLMGKGIGYVDLYLLVSSLLSPGTQLWTHDKRLQSLAAGLGFAFSSK